MALAALAPSIWASAAQPDVSQTRAAQLTDTPSVESTEPQHWELAKTIATIAGYLLGIFMLPFLVLLLLQGPEGFAKHHMPVRNDVLVIVSPLGAILAAMILGAGYRLARSRVGAILLGIVAMGQWSILLELGFGHGPLHWSTAKSMTAVIFTLVLGPVVGHAMRPDRNEARNVAAPAATRDEQRPHDAG